MTHRLALTLALLLASLGVEGCNQPSGSAPVSSGSSGVCAPFKTAESAAPAPGLVAPDQSANVVECLHRWAYALARAHESADVVAAATVTACGAEISSWNQQVLSQNQEQPSEATSLTTGQRMSSINEHAQVAQSQALFYVVQARAGNCAPPPARLLIKSGT